MMVPSGMVTSVMNCITLQLDVGGGSGVFVKTGRGRKVSVAVTGSGVSVFATSGVTLSNASIVSAAAVRLNPSPWLFEGRLHAPRNKAAIINRLKRRGFFFMIFFSFVMRVFYRRLSWSVRRAFLRAVLDAGQKINA